MFTCDFWCVYLLELQGNLFNYILVICLTVQYKVSFIISTLYLQGKFGIHPRMQIFQRKAFRKIDASYYYCWAILLFTSSQRQNIALSAYVWKFLVITTPLMAACVFFIIYSISPPHSHRSLIFFIRLVTPKVFLAFFRSIFFGKALLTAQRGLCSFLLNGESYSFTIIYFALYQLFG